MIEAIRKERHAEGCLYQQAATLARLRQKLVKPHSPKKIGLTWHVIRTLKKHCVHVNGSNRVNGDWTEPYNTRPRRSR